MLTFDDARARADAQLRPIYEGPGTFHVAEYGWEDATDYALIVGPIEAEVPEPAPEMIVADDVQTLVDKRAGILQRVNALANRGRDWREVGDWSKAPSPEPHDSGPASP